MYVFVIEGAEIHKHPIEPEDMLHDLQGFVHGYIEVVHPVNLREPYLMVVNECGLIDAMPINYMPINYIASLLYGSRQHAQIICGPAVICKEVWTEDGPDLGPLEESDLVSVLQQIYDVL